MSAPATNATDWEQHYRERDTPWEKGAANPALFEALERVELRGRILVPGCGLGHDVRALSVTGAEVLGLDLSPTAIEQAGQFPKGGQETYRTADLFALPPDLRGYFDAVWEHTCYCAISPAQRPAYVRACAQSLVPGGLHLGVFYLDPGQALATDGPPYETTFADLTRHFSPYFELIEQWSPKRTYPGREGREWLCLHRLSKIAR